jgi:trans-aconitate methyltransferase
VIDVVTPPMAPLAVYSAALRRAAAGSATEMGVVGADGACLAWLDPSMWVGGLVAGDRLLLDRCTGTTLDVGCGPGRLTAELTRRGIPTLGVDVSPEAVRQARRRGAPAELADVFGRVPDQGRWRTVLLADGNIGIGGDPLRLLRRCAALLGPSGTVLMEVRPPDETGWRAHVTLRDATGQSTAFPWAAVALHEARTLAARAGFATNHQWTEAGRWFVQLVRA